MPAYKGSEVWGAQGAIPRPVHLRIRTVWRQAAEWLEYEGALDREMRTDREGLLVWCRRAINAPVVL